MKSRFQGMRALATAMVTGGLTAFWSVSAFAEDTVGQPTNGAIDLQPGVTPLRDDAIFFHNVILLPIISAIVLLVLGLLLWCVFRYNSKANPVPAKWSHNTIVEVIWTSGPVLILMFIAIFSFKLLYAFHDMPPPDVTVKATGNQWYWSYEYPDQGGLVFDSNLIPEADLKPGQKRLLDVDNPLVVPVDTTIRVLITGTDVIHSWFVPSFGVQEYAIIGRLNESWMKIEHDGVYYGQCNQICGINHAFMPIKVQAVSKDDFQHWLVDAKKKFAHDDKGGDGVRVAAASGSPDTALPAPAGN